MIQQGYGQQMLTDDYNDTLNDSQDRARQDDHGILMEIDKPTLQDQKVIRQINKIKPDKLLKCFSDAGTIISPLKLIQFQTLQKLKPKSIIPAVPQLPQLGELLQMQDQKLTFYSFRQLSEMSLAATHTVQQSFFESKNKWRTYHTKLFHIENSTTRNSQHSSLHQSKLKLTDSCSQYEKFDSSNINLLKHNKEQFRQLSENMETRRVGTINENVESFQGIKPKFTHQNYQIPKKYRVSLSKIFQQKNKISLKTNPSDSMSNIQILDFLNNQYEVYWYNFDQNHLKPQIRESATMSSFRERIYLFGGIGQQIIGQCWNMDLQSLKWQQQTANLNPRYGHSMCYYKKSFVFFGGETNPKEDDPYNNRQHLNDVKIFNLENNKWVPITLYTTNQISPRRNHTASIVGKYMIVIGGIDTNSRPLNDVWSFDFCKSLLKIQSQALNKWSQADVEYFQFFSQGIAFHQACAVYHPQKKYALLYKPEEIKQINTFEKKSPYSNEGVYVFGGINKNDLIENKVFILKTNQKPMKWIELITTGNPPQGRYGHSMNFIDKIGLIILYGGRNLETFFNVPSWLKVQIHNDKCIPRAFHCTTLVNTKMYIFGGFNQNGFANSDIQVIIFNFTYDEILETESSHARSLNRKILIQGETFNQNQPKKQDDRLEEKQISEELKHENIMKQVQSIRIDVQRQKKNNKLNINDVRSMMLIETQKFTEQDDINITPLPISLKHRSSVIIQKGFM